MVGPSCRWNPKYALYTYLQPWVFLCSFETVQFLSYEEQQDRLIIPEFGIGRIGLSSLTLGSSGEKHEWFSWWIWGGSLRGLQGGMRENAKEESCEEMEHDLLMLVLPGNSLRTKHYSSNHGGFCLLTGILSVSPLPFSLDRCHRYTPGLAA